MSAELISVNQQTGHVTIQLAPNVLFDDATFRRCIEEVSARQGKDPDAARAFLEGAYAAELATRVWGRSSDEIVRAARDMAAHPLKVELTPMQLVTAGWKGIRQAPAIVGYVIRLGHEQIPFIGAAGGLIAGIGMLPPALVDATKDAYREARRDKLSAAVQAHVAGHALGN